MPTVLKVLLPLPLPPLSFLPPHDQPRVQAGVRVAVPWQTGVRIGVVAGTETLRSASFDLKEAVQCLDETPWLSVAALRTLERIAAYTFAPAGLALANLVPVGFSDTLEHELRAVAGAVGAPLGESWTPASSLSPETVAFCRQQGLAEERVRPVVPSERRLVALKAADEALGSSRQASQRNALAILESLGSVASAAELARLACVAESAVRTLVTKGYAGYTRVLAPLPELPAVAPRPPLRDVAAAPAVAGPQAVVGATRRARLSALLAGIVATYEAGGSVLVLVPEGALLAETAGIIASALKVRVFSADLNDAQRRRLWTLCREEPTVLVGTYPTLLAPVVNLQRVIVLEEASVSYKLSAGCRVFVPTAARVLAEAAGASLVFADATPSPESLMLAGGAVWSLPQRPPRVHIVDLASVSGWPLSADLARVLRQVAERARQAVLLSPRRGFSASLQCPSCGWTAMCPNCSLALRYHQDERSLRCHQCGHRAAPPPTCPSCHDPMVAPRGPGTQWLAREVARLLPGTPVYRFDRDRRDDLTGMATGEPGVVVATTAIFRHPPLPRVSLIAVTLLDSMLNGGDFRGDEQALRLLCNLPELSSQLRPLVVLQTFQPATEVLRVLRDDQEGGLGYSIELLERRKTFGYAPFTELAHVQITAKSKGVAERAANVLAGALRTGGARDGELLGPAPAPVERLRGQYCYQLVLRATDHNRLASLVQPALAYRGAARVRVDVDPRDMIALLE